MGKNFHFIRLIIVVNSLETCIFVRFQPLVHWAQTGLGTQFKNNFWQAYHQVSNYWPAFSCVQKF